MKKRDAIFDEVQLNLIRAIVGELILPVGTKLRYTDQPAMENGLDIPSWENVQSFDTEQYLQSVANYDTLQDLYYYINELIDDGVLESQILGRFYWGNGVFQKITQEDINNAKGGVVPPAPTNGIVDDTNKTFTFTESI